MPSRKPFAESLYSGGIFSMSSTEGHDSTRARALEPGAGWSWTFAHPPTPLSDARHHGTRARHDRSIETRVALARHPRAPSSRASIRATRVVGGEEDAGARSRSRRWRGLLRARGGAREDETRTIRGGNDVSFRSRRFRASTSSRARGVDGERDEIAWRVASPKRAGGGARARRRDEEGLTETFSPPQPSNKTFKVKKILGKKAKQNRPLPQWIRMRTDNKIRYVSFQGF